MSNVIERLETLRAAGGRIERTVSDQNGVRVVRRETIVQRYRRKSRYGSAGTFARPSVSWIVYGADGSRLRICRKAGEAARVAARIAAKVTA